MAQDHHDHPLADPIDPGLPLPPCRVEILRDRAAFEALAPEWEALTATTPAATAAHAFIAAALETDHRADTPHILLLRHQANNRLLGAVPLVRRRRWGLVRLELIGAPLLGEANILPVAAEAPAEAPAEARSSTAAGSPSLAHAQALRIRLLEALAAQPWPVRLARLVADTLPPLPTKRITHRGVMLRRPAQPACSLATDRPLAAILAGLSRRRRQTLRTARSRAEQTAPLTVTHHRPKPEAVLPLLTTAWAIEDASWKGRAGLSVCRSPTLTAFFDRLAHRLAAQGRFWVSVLAWGDQPVAMELGALHANRAWSFKCGFDDRFAALSPGHLLAQEAIAATCADPALHRYEFMGLCEPAKTLWRPDRVAMATVRLYPWRPGGLALLAIDGAALIGRRLLPRRPGPAAHATRP